MDERYSSSDTVNLSLLSLSELRSLVLEAFKIHPTSSYTVVCWDVAKLAVQKRIVRSPKDPGYTGNFYLDRKDEDRVREIIWYLIIERIVTIGKDSSNAEWPWLKLTDYGNEAVNSTLPVPHDPSGYIRRIKTEIPSLDPIILRYLEESLNTYNIDAILSSTITLGCASEKALLLLIESYMNALQDPGRQTKFKEKIEGRNIKRQFDEFTKHITNLIGNMPFEISDGLNNVLIGVFEMIRNNRNDAGHPTGKIIPKESLFANLQVFIPYCKKIYQLIGYLNSNPIN